ncbi:MAG TPA: ferritin-like domain-containing protein [Polyangiales bacterium]
MDKRSFYLLLSSVVSAALGACGDDSCPHAVVTAKKQHEADTDEVCERISAGVGQLGGSGIRDKDCAALCEDPKMNRCSLHSDYHREFSDLNPALGSPDAGPKQCPDWEPRMTIECTRVESRGGEWHEGCPIAGRRPAGLLAARGGERDEVADYLARAAHLEAASVFAFDKLAEDLARLGAPAALIDDCLRAARDESEHAQVMGKLARARNASPMGVDVVAHGNASALELALENVVEGVVREAYGALLAGLSGRRAADPEVRAAMAGIAEDEAAHAWLALRIADWLDARLSPAEHAQVAEAKWRAIAALREELEHEPSAALREQVGLPTRAEGLRMLAELEQNVWAASERIAA